LRNDRSEKNNIILYGTYSGTEKTDDASGKMIGGTMDSGFTVFILFTSL
jgi:hypothetical protein